MNVRNGTPAVRFVHTSLCRQCAWSV